MATLQDNGQQGAVEATEAKVSETPTAKMQGVGNGQTALITGGSSGIGLELAKCFAKDGFDLVLVAYNMEKLTKAASELHGTYGVDVKVLSQDLSVDGAAEQVYQRVTQLGVTKVDYLVNDAGFGITGTFVDTSLKRQEAMLHTNINTLTDMCLLFGVDMAARGSGGILNLASIAAFMPGPYMATYYASKAYVQSLSQALHTELHDYGVKVCALCPPPTKTAFFTKAGYGKEDLFQKAAMTTTAVAQQGYRSLMANRAQCLPGLFTKCAVFATRILPTIVVRDVIAALQKGSAKRADKEREEKQAQSQAQPAKVAHTA